MEYIAPIIAVSRSSNPPPGVRFATFQQSVAYVVDTAGNIHAFVTRAISKRDLWLENTAKTLFAQTRTALTENFASAYADTAPEEARQGVPGSAAELRFLTMSYLPMY